MMLSHEYVNFVLVLVTSNKVTELQQPVWYEQKISTQLKVFVNYRILHLKQFSL